MVHPGPWTQLPPAPSPFTPPWASSLPNQHRGWFKARVAPPNPFAEAHKVANYIAGRKAPKQPANQTKRSEVMSQSRKAPSPPKEKSDVGGQPSSRDKSNAAIIKSVPCISSVALPFDEPAPSEKPPCEDPPPPLAQTASLAASPPGLSGRNRDGHGESPAAGGLPEQLGDTPKLAQLVGLVSGLREPAMAPVSMDSSNGPGLGSSTQDGPLHRLAEGAHPPGSLTLPGDGAMADTAGGHGGADFAETGSLGGLASGHTPPAPASFGKPDLTQSGDLGGLASGGDLASFVGPGSLVDIGGGPGVPGVGECPAMGGLMEAACAGALAAAPGVSSIPKSFSVPAIFSGLEKGRTNPALKEVRYVC